MTSTVRTTQPDLTRVRSHLYALHAGLVQGERRTTERARGTVPPGEFLQALLHRPEHAWLRPLSALLARIDEHLAQTARGEGPPAESAEHLLGALSRLLSPPRPGTGFGDGYLERLQQDPEIVMAHARLRGALSQTAAEAEVA